MTHRQLLIVDDDHAFATVLARAMHRRGLRVHVAHTVDEALSVAAAVIPDKAVVDLMLGEDSGLALIQPLLRINPECRIVMLTGYASIPTAVDATKRGATNYLAKPVDANAVLRALDDGEAGGVDEPVTTARPLSLRRLEWEQIQRVLAEEEGNISAAARVLGMHRRTLQRKLRKRPPR